MRLLQKSLLFIFIALFGFVKLGFADSAGTHAQIKQFINSFGKEYELDPGYTYRLLSQANYLPEIIAQTKKPYEKLPWYRYRELFVTPQRVEAGVNFWKKNRKILDWAYKEYGVPPRIVVALIGIETKYGQQMGDHPVLDTLATLGFNYKTREKFFQKELASYLVLTKELEVDPTTIHGSYSGAMGMCQFMPSSYLNYGVDFQGHNRPDLFNDSADAIFSVANFLRQSGWDVDQPTAVQAKITGNRYRSVLVDNLPHRVHKPIFTLATLRQYGVIPAHTYNDRFKANLIGLDSGNGTEYWLGFHNFYVITRYNNSNLYAMAAVQLSRKIQEAWEQQNRKPLADKTTKAVKVAKK